MRPVLLLLLALLLARPALASTDPSDVLGIAYDQKPGATLPLDLRLADEAGEPVRLGDFIRGRPTLLALVYFHCPNLCGVVLGDLLTGLQATGVVPGQDYDLLAVSIDPSETPADASAAKNQHLMEFPTPGAAEGWHFLTGSETALASLEQAVGYRARFDPSFKQFIHPAGVVVVTPDGRVARYLLGVGYRANDLKLGLLDASTGAVATMTRAILLTCWHYDPTTGRYSLAILNLLRLAAVLTVATIGGVLYLAFRREGRAR
ncbi:MAG TPA: SCO family protein [Aliidongia sp.]|uniref:SCO family protein n=1 Tax=Aliidongia sp. TaxID=1914230 RepID=UPI002DDCB1E8|nr:SCO family protein [Aliidongia sp.]HEV2673245.1 SCO family protein [Aliidongia sp.]